MYRLHGFTTQNSMKTLYVLEELGVDYEYRYVNLFKGEQKTPEFLAMNPVGKAPVLEHDGEFLWESGAIVRYLGNVEGSPLYPAEPLERGRVDQWLDFFTCHLGNWLSSIFFEKIIKPAAGLGATSQSQVERSEAFARQFLAVLDPWLARHPWVAGEALSIADLFGFAYVVQVDAIDFPLDEWPHVKAWREKVQQRPAIARARARLPQ